MKLEIPLIFDHFVRFFDIFFNRKLIITRGPITSTSESPDLTTMDFFLLGHLQNWIYAESPEYLDS